MVDTSIFDLSEQEIAWCPGCGNFGILKELKIALSELKIPPENLVMVSGIGQAAKIPQYLKTNYFNGLHGRSLPVATAIKACNPTLTVIAESGDGCMYGEGGNHFIHAIRRNPNITNIIHNNMVYGLTKGQASPTSQRGFKTPVQINGVMLEPFNPLAVAISLDASFVARTYSGDLDLTVEILKNAITHKGYALIDILQPCVSFNKVNTYQWYKEHTYPLAKTHDPSNREKAFKKAIEQEKLALGIFYINNKPTFEDNLPLYRQNKDPLFQRDLNLTKLTTLINSKKR
ncbi:MAG TPA: thiamine pyrophosphate-dependent enzyme [Candidatus Deferrimicrobium sp.]|nr:thiamine pyrophosphate-dependent enzyme [Candidatus Deferrimicrobium sp.]